MNPTPSPLSRLIPQWTPPASAHPPHDFRVRVPLPVPARLASRPTDSPRIAQGFMLNHTPRLIARFDERFSLPSNQDSWVRVPLPVPRLAFGSQYRVAGIGYRELPMPDHELGHDLRWRCGTIADCFLASSVRCSHRNGREDVNQTRVRLQHHAVELPRRPRGDPRLRRPVCRSEVGGRPQATVHAAARVRS